MRFVFDNSNLNESYAGVTTPLTFSFARRVYQSVYIEFCRFMGVPEEVISAHPQLFPNMLAYIGCRMYYNLSNWHTMISFFPGYSLNGPFLEEMLGVEVKYRGAVNAQKNGLLTVWVYISEWVKVFRLTAQMLVIFINMRSFINSFDKDFEDEYKQLSAINLNSLNLDQLQNAYLQAEVSMTKHFRIPIANDFAVMISVGVLRKLCKNWLGDVDERLASVLIAGRAGIKSAEPGKALYEIIYSVQISNQLKSLYAKDSVQYIWRRLSNNHLNPELQTHKVQLLKYVQDYGYRVPGELKLESLSFQVEPELLIGIIKSQLRIEKNDSNIQRTTTIGNSKDLSDVLVKDLVNALSVPKKLFFNIIQHWAKASITRREETRFKRTLIFGLARKFFLKMADKLVQKKILKQQADIFYLTVEEVCSAQNQPHKLLQARADGRKNYLMKSKKIDTKNRVEASKLPVSRKLYQTASQQKVRMKKTSLKGRVACLGGQQLLTGNAVVMQSFDPNRVIKDKILVAAQTDPGWTVIFPSLKAIIVERGGILSHASIVAREFNIPCVINCTQATKIIKDGQKITINLETGTVTS